MRDFSTVRLASGGRFSNFEFLDADFLEPVNRLSRIRVLHFASSINRLDFIDTIVRHADDARFEMSVCTFWEPNIAPPSYPPGIDSVYLRSPRRWHYPALVWRLARVLRKRRIDILHTHHFAEAVIGTLAAKLAGRPAVVIGRHYCNEVYLLSKGVKRQGLLELEGFANRRAARIVVPSSAIRDFLIEKQSIDPSRVAHIPYGFEFDQTRYLAPTAETRAAARAEFGIAKQTFLIGNCARHHHLKGQRYLLQAFKRFHDVHPDSALLLVGDGPEGQALRLEASRLWPAHGELESPIKFAGWRRDAHLLIGAMDMMVHPSLHDALSQLMIETLALGVPLAITNVPGTSDHVRHEENALIIEMHDVDTIVQSMEWVYRNPEKARTMGERGRSDVRQSLDIERVIHLHERNYLAVLGLTQNVPNRVSDSAPARANLPTSAV